MVLIECKMQKRNDADTRCYKIKYNIHKKNTYKCIRNRRIEHKRKLVKFLI